MTDNSKKIARRRGTARKCTGSYLRNLPDNRGNQTGVTAGTRGRGRSRGRGRGRINDTERVHLAQIGRVVPPQTIRETFDEQLARYAREDAERLARYELEDAAAAEIDAEFEAEEQTTESESELEAEPVTQTVVPRSRSRIPANIQPTSVRVIPTRTVSSSEHQDPPITPLEPEPWVADLAVTAPEEGPHTEPTEQAEPEAQQAAPITEHH